MMDACGVHHYFDNQEEYETLKKILSKTSIVVKESDRAEYGDFQTNIDLAINVAKYLKHNSINPKIIIEPTCGKGNFIVA
jgi:arginyl-tRNA synthetase